MIRGVIAALCLGGIAASSPAQAPPSLDELARTPMITLRISESLRTSPDQATLNVSTDSKAPTATAALDANRAETERLMAAIRAAGIGPRDIQTSSVSVQPDYRFDQVAGRSQQRMVGYSASTSVRIRTRRIDRLSGLLDALTTAGADRISGPMFDLADRAPLRREARKLALARGAAEAGEYAVAAGFARARLLGVEEGISSNTGDFVVMAARAVGDVAPPAPPPPPPPGGGALQPGQVETGVVLTLRYRMER